MNFDLESKVYVFYIDNIDRKYIYYRTFSVLAEMSSRHGRDVRKASTVDVKKFNGIMTLLNQPVTLLREDVAIYNVIKQKNNSWLLFPAYFTEKYLQCLLRTHECVVSPIGLFWDIKLPGRRASRRIPDNTRKKVLERDDNQCIECGKSNFDGIELAMDHVIPFSRGGESSSGNLVTLCKSCNQKHGNEHHPHLFVLAGLDHDWAPQLLDNAIPDANNLAIATYLSSNIMASRCKISDFPDSGH